MLKQHVREVRSLNFQKDPSNVSRDKDAWPLKRGPIVCPETSATIYQFMLPNIPEERRSHVHRGGNLKLRLLTLCTAALRNS